MIDRRVHVLGLALVGVLLGRPAACQEPDAHEVVHALVAAFNGHDPDAMAALVAEDFELYQVGSDGAAVLSIRGRHGLARDMREYFAARPSVRSRVEAVLPGMRFVAFRERIEGGASALAVYEVEAGLIRRAWYYPAR